MRSDIQYRPNVLGAAAEQENNSTAKQVENHVSSHLLIPQVCEHKSPRACSEAVF